MEWSEAQQIRLSTGIRAMGLPYETRPHFEASGPLSLCGLVERCPEHILFNGGAAKPPVFQRVVMNTHS